VDPTLQAMYNAWDKEIGQGREEVETRKLADKFVAEHPEFYNEAFRVKSEPELVRSLDVLRQAEMHEEVARIQAWLWHHFEPQQIGGEVQSVIRVVPAVEDNDEEND